MVGFIIHFETLENQECICHLSLEQLDNTKLKTFSLRFHLFFLIPTGKRAGGTRSSSAGTPYPWRALEGSKSQSFYRPTKILPPTKGQWNIAELRRKAKFEGHQSPDSNMDLLTWGRPRSASEGQGPHTPPNYPHFFNYILVLFVKIMKKVLSKLFYYYRIMICCHYNTMNKIWSPQQESCVRALDHSKFKPLGFHCLKFNTPTETYHPAKKIKTFPSHFTLHR